VGIGNFGGAYKDGCKHINLAANVCGYTPINLGKIIKDGILSNPRILIDLFQSACYI